MKLKASVPVKMAKENYQDTVTESVLAGVQLPGKQQHSSMHEVHERSRDFQGTGHKYDVETTR